MSVYEQRFSELNPAQKKAVETTEGPVMVIAGPGSGKTQILALRVANILKKNSETVSPGNILCLTYTESGAYNMRKRLIEFIGKDAYKVTINTFHGFGSEIISRYSEYFYDGASFLPADDVTQREVLSGIFNDLDRDNPLASKHGSEFNHLVPALKIIEQLKKAGLTPEKFKRVLELNKKAMEFADPIIGEVFTGRLSKSVFPQVAKVISELKKYKSEPLPNNRRSYIEYLADSLEDALAHAQAENKTAPLSDWKETWLKTGEDEQKHLIDWLNMPKHEALADIYESYVAKMYEAGYYDFDDMILETISKLESNSDFRLNLQERYQYILVDEFQDTNDAQMRLLNLLTDHPVHEGNPNIMVVGDDDQAIFKFQGAEISNILDFKKLYPKAATIVLTENYRSTQKILDLSRHIIKKGINRLEKIDEAISKELVAANKKLEAGHEHMKEFETPDAERRWVVAEIKKLIKSGAKANEIAIIARRHRDLEAIVPYLNHEQIPAVYERQQNVLKDAHILQLVTMAKYIASLMKDPRGNEDLLPEILSYPFWNIPRGEVWELAVKAQDNRKIPWLGHMRNAGGRFAEIAEFFLKIAGDSQYQTAEEILHELIGGPDMFSPYRSYYFGDEQRTKNWSEYYRRLTSLRSFINALRHYHQGRYVSVPEMLEFVRVREENDMPIYNTSQFANAEHAINLLSAHKAKGLEFEAVFVINCQESIWAKSKSRGTSLIPNNLPITPDNDGTDDQIRLFFVAITRAKRFLYLTSYQTDENTKPSTRLSFITHGEGVPEAFKPEKVALEDAPEAVISALEQQLYSIHDKPFTADEKAILKPVLERYRLSVTHLQNFLNVEKGGPVEFFEKNLLRFPTPKIPSGSYGTAVHDTLTQAHAYLKTEGSLAETEKVLEWFEKHLSEKGLNEREFQKYLKSGRKELERFYEARKSDLDPKDLMDLDFGNQGVVVGKAELSGKIDWAKIDGGKMIVADFKTGDPFDRWDTSESPYKKIKAWQYKLQLIFYKILVENSKDYSKFKVEEGRIEFIEPKGKKIISLPLQITDEDVDRVSRLIKIVHEKIINLDFPDISKYSKDIKGILAFEEDLLDSE